MRKWNVGLKAAVTVGLLAASGAALAFPISPQTCGQFQADPAISCVDGVDQTDTVDGVNAAYPRMESWEYIDKDDELVGDTEPAPGFVESDFFLTDAEGNPFDPGNDTSGFFYISDAVIAAFDELVLAMKGGNDEPRWAAFLLDLQALVAGEGNYEGYSYGAWQTRQGLSHATLYGYGDGGDDNNVPEPGSLMLLGLGLLGVGAARRRKVA